MGFSPSTVFSSSFPISIPIFPFISFRSFLGLLELQFLSFSTTNQKTTNKNKKVNELLVVSCGLSLQPLLETGVKSSQSLHLLSYIRVSRKVSC
ncbi:hypothetical protein P8452_57905 [Trifolium repens]|nr:hypothetical protein P8452_57905 [Trifolium repens]